MGSLQTTEFLKISEVWLILSPQGEVWVDVEAFEIAARSARRSGEPAEYQLALALYTSELLPEDRYDDWVTPLRNPTSPGIDQPHPGETGRGSFLVSRIRK